MESDLGCPFCSDQVKAAFIEEYGSAAALRDRNPVTPGHVLVIPKRHTPDYFSMTDTERRDAHALLRLLRDRIQEDDASVTGFNVGTNNGRSAGQTIFHAHIHLIPRRDGDTPEPRGGVRGVIPGKRGY